MNFMAFDLDAVPSGEGKELPICYELKRPHVGLQDFLFLDPEHDAEVTSLLELLLEGQTTFDGNEQDCPRLVGVLLRSLSPELKQRFAPQLDARLNSISNAEAANLLNILCGSLRCRNGWLVEFSPALSRML